MDLYTFALRPGAGLVVMVHLGEQHGVAILVDDDANIPIDPHGPEIWVLGSLDAVEGLSLALRVNLQVECRRASLLFGELAKRFGKGIGVAGDHGAMCTPFPLQFTHLISNPHHLHHLIPRWLMTLTAIWPEADLGKGRDRVRFSVAQASASISALSVVLSAFQGRFFHGMRGWLLPHALTQGTT